MHTYLRSGLAGLFMAAGCGLAAAQTVVIQPEQEVLIKEYVHKEPLASIDLPGVELNIGTKLGEEVELRAVEVPDVNYSYVVIDGRTVLVDPATREIVHIIQ